MMANENMQEKPVWLVIHYFCCENSKRNIEHIHKFDSLAMARAAMNIEIENFRKNANLKDVLHDRGTENRHEIDVRSGANRWYTWEICAI